MRLTIDKSNNLQECLINFEVVQDYSSGVRGEKITLGHVTLNLAEYVEESEMGPDGEEGVTRRYLMQESKINSTLKIGIMMKQIDGERNFTAPPLKTAPVFGGIAGIMAGEQAEQDDVGREYQFLDFWDGLLMRGRHTFDKQVQRSWRAAGHVSSSISSVLGRKFVRIARR